MRVIIISLFAFVCIGKINAQEELSSVISHFDSICENCPEQTTNILLYKACKAQDSLISQKRELLLSIVAHSHSKKLDSIIVAGFDKLVDIENKHKENIISVFESLYSGTILSYQAGIVTYYYNEKTLELLQFYIYYNDTR